MAAVLAAAAQVKAGHARAGIAAGDGQYRGSRGPDPEVIAEITKRYGFDKPLHERYFTMLWNYMRFDFGDSLFRGASVMQLIGQSLPVSITLGLWSTLIIYGVDPARYPQGRPQRQRVRYGAAR